MSVASD